MPAPLIVINTMQVFNHHFSVSAMKSQTPWHRRYRLSLAPDAIILRQSLI